MNLDDPDLIPSLDSRDMLAYIRDLPDQLENAYLLGMQNQINTSAPIQSVIITGMGGSAIGGDLLAAYAAPVCRVPLLIHRDYDLPAWAAGPGVLVVASSHSGNTEETLSAYRCALQRGCSTLALSTGGELLDQARQRGLPHWRFEHSGQPRSAVGYSFGLTAAALVQLSLLPDLQSEIQSAASLMRLLQKRYTPQVPVARNRAMRDAGQLIGRWVMVFGAEHLAPVARRWKGQINELAKAAAQAEILPEADHNCLAGTLNPEQALMRSTALFLQAGGYHPRNQIRIELTRSIFLEQGLGTDIFDAPGETRMQQIWSAVHYGDYLAYYLALAYGMDPTPVDILQDLKLALKEEADGG